MTPAEFAAAGIKLYGRKKWREHFGRALGVDPVTIWRMTRRAVIPGPYAVATRALLDNKAQQDELNKRAAQLLRDRKKGRRK